MEYAAAVAAIVGLVNGVRLLKDKDLWGFVFFALAMIAGLILGALHWFGLPGPEAGFAAALASSGLYRVFQVNSGK